MAITNSVRRTFAAGFLAAIAPLAAHAGSHSSDATPIIFVHGDSDTAALWTSQIWRFESNGYPRDRLFAIDLDNPGARSHDTKPQPNRSSTTDVASQLGGFVSRVLITTGADKVALVGNSRGCQTIRNYVQNGGGAALAETLVLTGCVHKGVFVAPGVAMGSEYNGAGDFLTKLNADGEVVPGLKTVTIRSDKFDLYNQPMGDFIGRPGQPTGATFDGPALQGAENLVLPGVDHRETAYSPAAFAMMYRAITGKQPETTKIAAEESVTLDGEVSGWANSRPTNLPLARATVRVFETDPATGDRIGDKPVHEQTTSRRGRWGPFQADPTKTYEFVIRADGYPIHHIFRSRFPRSSQYVNLRLYPAENTERNKAEGLAELPAGIGIMRPRGYFGPDDTLTVNGQTTDAINDNPVPNVWKFWHPSEKRRETIRAEFNGEVIVGKARAVDSRVAWIEFTY